MIVVFIGRTKSLFLTESDDTLYDVSLMMKNFASSASFLLKSEFIFVYTFFSESFIKTYISLIV